MLNFFFKLKKSAKIKNAKNIVIKINFIIKLIFFIFCFNFKKIKFLKRLVVQMVERTAHNGLVVGSNPTKPIFSIIKKFKGWL